MWFFGALGSVLLILLILIDAFVEAMGARSGVTHARFRLARILLSHELDLLPASGFPFSFPRREASPIVSWPVWPPVDAGTCFATWMIGLILGFAWLHNSLDTAVHSPEAASATSSPTCNSERRDLFDARLWRRGRGCSDGAVLDRGRSVAGVSGFLACVIGYLPAIFQAFSRREVIISLFDARAGSPPCASQLLLRAARARNSLAVIPFLAEWERWAAELLESHLSFPVLSYYRSRTHDNQSWLAALTTILDTCAPSLSPAWRISTPTRRSSPSPWPGTPQSWTWRLDLPDAAPRFPDRSAASRTAGRHARGIRKVGIWLCKALRLSTSD